MARQTSRASGARRSSPSPSGRPAPAPLHSSAPPRQASASPPPAPQPQAAPAAPNAAAPPALGGGGGGGGFLSNMMGTVASGMASGVGFGVAQRAVDAVLGPRKTEVVHTTQSAPEAAPAAPLPSPGMSPSNPVGTCQQQQDELNQCISRHSDVSLCQNYFDALKTCQTSMGGARI